ncbi:MAG: bifunctional phosphoglucose/phosphomannose isomerase [Thermoplasmata archaeon]
MRFIEELKTLKEQVKFDSKFEIYGNFENIVIAGMGGSGIVGSIFKELYTLKPVVLVDDYYIPDFVNEKTLFIAISYSGNTEETLTATDLALEKKATVFTITSGGNLKEKGAQTVTVPKGLQPRSSIGYMLMPLLNTFMPQSKKRIDNAHRMLDEMDQNNEHIKAQAYEIFEDRSIPVIYGHSPFKAVAYRWKTQFNENSKILAYSNSFPELNHNDTMPLRDTYRKDNFIFFTFSSTKDKIKNRINITADITKTFFVTIDPIGGSIFEKLFYLIHYGDYLSYHLANYRGMMPEDVGIIEELKLRMKTAKQSI